MTFTYRLQCNADCMEQKWNNSYRTMLEKAVSPCILLGACYVLSTVLGT